MELTAVIAKATIAFGISFSKGFSGMLEVNSVTYLYPRDAALEKPEALRVSRTAGFVKPSDMTGCQI